MLEAITVVMLIVLNGFFALSELAVINARRPRLQSLAAEGKRGASSALALFDNPGRFLPTVQIGITLVSILTGSVSGAAFGSSVIASLQGLGLAARLAEPLGVGLVVGTVTLVTVVIGELVPKRFALRSPEAVACTIAPCMTALARIATPGIWVLDGLSSIVLRLFRVSQMSDVSVTDDEIHAVVADAEGAGVIEPEERHMIAGVMRLGDRSVRGVMTPRTDVDWIDLHGSEDDICATLSVTQHSRLPVGEGTPDGMLGVVQTRELLCQMLGGRPLDIRASLRTAPAIADTAEALDVLGVLRGAEVPMALVHDEHGHFQGVVTPADLLEAIAGIFRADADAAEPAALRRDDGTWLIAGWLPADEMAAHLHIKLPKGHDYVTAAGYVLAELRRLPELGEHIHIDDWRFEVTELERHRIAKLVVTPARANRSDRGGAQGDSAPRVSYRDGRTLFMSPFREWHVRLGPSSSRFRFFTSEGDVWSAESAIRCYARTR